MVALKISHMLGLPSSSHLIAWLKDRYARTKFGILKIFDFHDFPDGASPLSVKLYPAGARKKDGNLHFQRNLSLN